MEQNIFARYRMAYLTSKFKVFKISMALVLCFTLFSINPALAQTLNAEQKKEVKSLIENYLQENPQVIVDAFRNFHKKSQANKNKNESKLIHKYREALINNTADPSIGSPASDLTIVEFFDYRCGYCRKSLEAINTILNEDQKIKVVFKELPILSEQSEMAARAALAVNKISKNKYFLFHTKLMQKRGSFKINDIYQIAKDIDISVNSLKSEINSPWITRAIKQNQVLAENLGIRGTPAFVIGDKIVPGAVSSNTMKNFIKQARRLK